MASAPAPQPPPQPAPAGGGLEQEIDQAIRLVKKEVPTTISGVSELPMHLLLILLGAGLAILLGLMFFFVQLGFWHPLSAFITLMVCMIFGVALVFAFIATKQRRLFGGVLSGVFCLILIVAGGPAGLIGGIVGLCGVAIIFLKEFEIIPK